jgi:hypothetical protein
MARVIDRRPADGALDDRPHRSQRRGRLDSTTAPSTSPAKTLTLPESTARSMNGIIERDSRSRTIPFAVSTIDGTSHRSRRAA